MDIAEWLASLGLASYAPAFRDNHIDAETLPSLTADDLRELGVVSIGHRRRILAAIEALQKGEARAVESDAPAAEHPESERRQVTVLFADIAGFSTLSSEIDAEQVHALLSAFFEQVDRIIADCGGRIDKHIGDCAMAVFGVPTAHGDDVRRAVAAAIAIHATMAQVSQAVGRPIAAHVGIASGEVVASRTGSSRYTEYTVTGETVNLASRLTGVAQDGETVVSADIVNTLGEAVDATFGGSQPVKGFAAPVDIWRVRGLRDVASQHRPLVGRRAEMAQCAAALSATRDGESGALLYIRGEPGIGKSSLAAETLHEARRLGFTGLRAALFDFGTGLDRDPLRGLAIALLATLDPAADVAEAVATFAATQALAEFEVLSLKDLAGVDLSADERRLLDAMSPAARLTARGEALGGLATAAARSARLLVIVEDVHWADPVTLQCLAAMARIACEGSRTILLMTARLEGDPIQVLQPSLSGLSLVLIELGRLRAQYARALAAGLLDSANPLLEQCIDRAGGNPLFLEQLIRHASTGGLASAIPGSIRSVVSAQIDRLAASDKSALQAAAVLGHQFSIDAMRRVLGRADWNPDTLIANRLLLPGKDTLQFAHALIREGIYASVLKTERRRLHQAAAQWFVGRDSALYAEHLAKAEDPAAVTAYLAAAAELVAQYRLYEALGLLERADGIAQEGADRFAVKVRQGDLLTELGRSADAIAAYDDALAIAPNQQAAAVAKLGKAGTMRLLDRNSEALALLDEAEPLFADEARLAELARLEHLRGNLLYPLGRTEACEAAQQKAYDHAKRCGSVELEARALGGLGDAAYASGRYVTARQRFVECIELARQHGFGRIEVANAPMIGAGLVGNLNDLLAGTERAIQMAANALQPRAELVGHHGFMILSLWAARPDVVEPHFQRAQEIVSQLGAHRFRGLNLTLMGEAHRQLGDQQRAAAMHDEALAIARQGGMSYIGAIVLGHRALAAGGDALRRESLHEAEQVLSQANVALNASFFYPFAIESCLRARDWGEARRFADCLAERFKIERVPAIEFQVQRGQLLAELGATGPSASLRQALQECRQAGRELGLNLFLGLLDQALDHAAAASSRNASARVS